MMLSFSHQHCWMMFLSSMLGPHFHALGQCCTSGCVSIFQGVSRVCADLLRESFLLFLSLSQGIELIALLFLSVKTGENTGMQHYDHYVHANLLKK